MIVAVALAVGLLGGAALASWAGARQTASTFAAYERAVKLSDLAVNTFVPDLKRVRAIAQMPGVETSATYLGLNAYPVVRGKVVTQFRYTGVFGSLDGRFFTQDTATVVKGRLPKLDATDELALSPKIAAQFGVRVGDHVKYFFADTHSKPLTRTTFRVVGIVKLPPVIVDENNIIEGAVLPPAATRAHLASLSYAWQGIRLVDGERGIGSFLDSLRSNPTVNSLPPVTQRYDETRVQAQRSIRPQAVALALFGLAAAIVALALGGLGVSRLSRRWSREQLALRALGMTRLQRASTFGLDSAIATAVGMALALAFSIAVSPLWPLGTVHEIAPHTGLHADLTVLLGAGSVLTAALFTIAAVSAWRTANDRGARGARARRSVVVSGANRSGVPVSGVLGAHFALDRGDEPRSIPVRATILAGATATTAVIAALVFGACLQGLVTHPVRYGWAWDKMLIAEAGYGSLKPALMEHLIDRERGVTDWSLLAFSGVTINGTPVPVLGVDTRKGHLEPPVLSGRAVSSDHEIAIGKSTLVDLGRHIGDRVQVAADKHSAAFTIVGSDTFPSVGVGGADHTSLGRGALLTYHAMSELIAPGAACGTTEAALCPQAIAFDVAPGADGDAVVRRISAADPDGTPGGTYEQPVTRAADIRNYDEMRSLPIALAAFLATATAVAFLVTLVTAVRARKRDLALLRTLGLTTRQVKTALIVQTLVTVFVTLVIGIPLGILAGRLTWIRYAGDIGVDTHPVVPLLLILVVAGAVALLAAAFTLIPASATARSSTAQTLRTE